MTANGTIPSTVGTEGLQTPLPGATRALMLLLTINLFNYIDRYVLAAVEPEIEHHLFGNASEEEAGFWMGLLSSAFLVTYTVAAPVFGWLAERYSRWMLVGIGVIIWSLASGASGVDWHADPALAYWMLFLTRCLVGIGEGAYGPVAPAMISDLYPVKIRGRVMAWFYAAIPVGSALGFTLGGQVKDLTSLTWRLAFFLVVPPGLILALICFFMREPTRGLADPGSVPPRRSAGWRDYLQLLRIPSYLLNTLGMTAMTFTLGGLAYWFPKYLKERQALGEETGIGEMKGVSLFGVVVVVSGLLATLAGGTAGDRLRRRFSGSYFLVSGMPMVVAFPLILGVIWTPFPTAWLFLFLAVFCLFFNTGPTNTILANVTHPAVRARGFAFNILIIHAFGDVISPPIMGAIRDRSSLDVAFIFVSILTLLGGIFWLLGARYLQRDTERAPLSLPE